MAMDIIRRKKFILPFDVIADVFSFLDVISAWELSISSKATSSAFKFHPSVISSRPRYVPSMFFLPGVALVHLDGRKKRREIPRAFPPSDILGFSDISLNAKAMSSENLQIVEQFLTMISHLLTAHSLNVYQLDEHWEGALLNRLLNLLKLFKQFRQATFYWHVSANAAPFRDILTTPAILNTNRLSIAYHVPVFECVRWLHHTPREDTFSNDKREVRLLWLRNCMDPLMELITAIIQEYKCSTNYPEDEQKQENANPYKGFALIFDAHPDSGIEAFTCGGGGVEMLTLEPYRYFPHTWLFRRHQRGILPTVGVNLNSVIRNMHNEILLL